MVPSGLVSAVPLVLDPYGTALDNYRLQTVDTAITIDIARGTDVKDSTGKALATISAVRAGAAPIAPPSSAVVLAYTFGPDGAKFNPAITLTLKYELNNLPQGADEKTLYIALWDTATNKWVELPSTVDTANHTITAKISHFSLYTVIVEGTFTTTTTSPVPTSTPKTTTTITPVPTTTTKPAEPTALPIPTTTPDQTDSSPVPLDDSRSPWGNVIILGVVFIVVVASTVGFVMWRTRSLV
jgi:hypothetical protein